MDLRDYLDSLDIDVPTFSMHSGLSQTTIYRYLRGHIPTIYNALLIDKATNGNVSVQDFVRIEKERLKKSK